MGYKIEPLSIISFLDENNMKLPRFQRKATWDKKQNFELAISVFQDYPVGVVIVNKDQNSSWLLDGRQRRNALKIMRENPVAVYEWAINYIGFGRTEDELGVREKYWAKVEKYLQTETKVTTTEEQEESNALYDGSEEEVLISDEDSFDSQKQRKGLGLLLDIILMVHQNKPSGSRWQQAFDFTSFFTKLRYAPQRNGGKVDPVLLRNFLLQLAKEINASNSECTVKDFVDYYDDLFETGESNLKKFEARVEKNWDYILKSLIIIEQSEKIFSEARIGVIWLTNASPLDAQNIFSRINKGGTQLKAEELLSAKPYWNVEVEYVDQDLKDKIKEMYSKLEVATPSTVVRWDLAATLISRIKDDKLIFDDYALAKKNNDISLEEVSLGFKTISSFYSEGMSAKCILDIEIKDNINWNQDIQEMINEINTICEILLSTEFFKFLQSWKVPIIKLLGNAVALEFLTIIWKDWNEKGKPTVSSANLKALQRDAKILFDRLVFEYATKVWRGSGDSKMSNDIKNWKERIKPIPKEDWFKFIEGACNGMYNGSATTAKLLKPVLYYYYVLTDCIPINLLDVKFDVDHIIPQAKFKNNSLIDESFKDSLINLAILPRKENISKSDKALNEITDSWLKKSITEYSGIVEEHFDKYSDIANINELKKERFTLFKIAFDTNRDAKLSN